MNRKIFEIECKYKKSLKYHQRFIKYLLVDQKQKQKAMEEQSKIIVKIKESLQLMIRLYNKEIEHNLNLNQEILMIKQRHDAEIVAKDLMIAELKYSNQSIKEDYVRCLASKKKLMASISSKLIAHGKTIETMAGKLEFLWYCSTYEQTKKIQFPLLYGQEDKRTMGMLLKKFNENSAEFQHIHPIKNDRDIMIHQNYWPSTDVLASHVKVLKHYLF